MSKIWHKTDEEPMSGKWVLLRNKEGWYHVGRKSVGTNGMVWMSDGCSAFSLFDFVEWAYIEDIEKVTKYEKSVSEIDV